jgi:hypothetical protein
VILAGFPVAVAAQVLVAVRKGQEGKAVAVQERIAERQVLEL